MKTTRPPGRSACAGRRHAGYALFEALVAVVVLSVGFIGAARMQTVGLKLNNSAHSRQKASLLAYQMTDRIRANAAASYVGATAGATRCMADAAGCTPADMAAADTAEWQADLAAQLPSGAGIVCVDSTPGLPTKADASFADPKCDDLGNTTVVKVFWTDRLAASGSAFTAPVRPQ